MRRFVLVFILFALLSGCDKIPFLSKISGKPAAPTSEPSASEQKMNEINGALLARVNNWAIGLDDFNGYLSTLEPVMKGQGINVDIQSPEFKQRLLQDFVTNQILAQIALSRGIDKNTDVRRALRDYKTTLLSSKIRAELEKTINISYAEVETFYNENKDYLRQPGEVKVSEIAVDSEFDAKDIAIKLLQGESFADLAKKYSTIESAKDGGDLGFVVVGDPKKKFPKFWNVVVTLEKGQVSQYFKNEADGKYYILKVEDERGGEAMPLTQVEDQIKQGLKIDKLNAEIDRLVSEFKAKAKIEINEDLIR